MTQAPPPYARPLAQLPLREWGLVHCPAIPYWVDKDGDPDAEHIDATLAALQLRGAEGMPAYSGLGTKYTIDSQTHGAYEFLYGSQLATDATGLSLDQAKDFTLPWTTYGDVYEDSQSLVEPFAQTLQTTAAADKAFWPTIAAFGLPYYLLVLEKVTSKNVNDFATKFAKVWTAEKLDKIQQAGRLYAIDMSILETLEPFTARDGTVRFTPGTITLLVQDPKTKELTPAAILLSTTDGKPARVYGFKDQAWLYALQAAKTSITVWGIWLGHVYHLHIVTAAMQMTMYNHLPSDHRLLPLLEPQSQSLIDFDYVLATALFGKISPPTPVSGPPALLKLLDTFAKGRTFLGDDPQAELNARGLDKADFSKNDGLGPVPTGGVAARGLEHHVRVRGGGRRRCLYEQQRGGGRHRPEGVDGCVRRPVARQPQVVSGRHDARRAHERAHEPPVPGQRARGWNPDPVGLPGARLRRELPAVSPERRHSRAGHFGEPCGAAPVPAEHRHLRRDDDVLLHVRLLGAIRAADSERRHPDGPLLPTVAGPVQCGAVQVQTGHPRLRRHVRPGLERGGCAVPRGASGIAAVVCQQSIWAVVGQHRALNRLSIGAAGIERATSRV